MDRNNKLVTELTPQALAEVFAWLMRGDNPSNAESVISPVPENQVLNTPGKLNYVQQNTMREDTARQNASLPQAEGTTLRYPEWLANAPKPTMPSSVPTPNAIQQRAINNVQSRDTSFQNAVVSKPNSGVEVTMPQAGVSWESFVESAKRVAAETGYPLAVILGQAALETGRKSFPGNNFFGIKGQGTAGTQYLATKEANPTGQLYDTADEFAKYHTAEDSIRDYVRLIKERYPQAWEQRKDPQRMVLAIKAGGYATDPNYVPKVTGTPEFRKYVNYKPPPPPPPVNRGFNMAQAKPGLKIQYQPPQQKQMPKKVAKPQQNVVQNIVGGLNKFFRF